MAKERMISMDMLKLFAIACVLVGHCVQYLHGQSYVFKDDMLFGFIYSFHMPLFMLVAGYFAHNALKKPFWVFFKSKFLQLIYPAVVCGILAIGLQKVLGVGYYDIHWVLFSSFWFLRSLFVCYLVVYLVRKIVHNPWFFVLISILLTRINDTSHIAFMYPFFLLGLGLSVYQEQIRRHAKLLLTLSTVVFIACLLWWNGSYTVYFSPVPTLTNCLRDSSTLGSRLLIEIYRFVTGASGSLMFLGFFSFLFRRSSGKLSHSISEVGKETLKIYVLQVFLIEMVFSAYPFLNGYSGVLYDLSCIGIGLASVIFLFAVSRAVSYYPIVDFILFGSKNTTRNR